MGYQAGRLRRVQIYEFILDYKRAHDGNSPSIREIQDGVGISSPSVVNHHLQRLVKLDAIEIHNGRIQTRGGMWIPPVNFIKQMEVQ